MGCSLDQLPNSHLVKVHSLMSLSSHPRQHELLLSHNPFELQHDEVSNGCL